MDYNENDKKETLDGFDKNNSNSDESNTYTTFSEVELDDSYQQKTSSTNGFAIASLVLGILSIPCYCCCGFGLILGILGLVFGLLSKKGSPNFSGLAIGGIICSILGIIAGLYSIVVTILAINNAGGIEAYIEQTKDLYKKMQNGETINSIKLFK